METFNMEQRDLFYDASVKEVELVVIIKKGF